MVLTQQVLDDLYSLIIFCLSLSFLNKPLKLNELQVKFNTVILNILLLIIINNNN